MKAYFEGNSSPLKHIGGMNEENSSSISQGEHNDVREPSVLSRDKSEDSFIIGS